MPADCCSCWLGPGAGARSCVLAIGRALLLRVVGGSVTSLDFEQQARVLVELLEAAQCCVGGGSDLFFVHRVLRRIVTWPRCPFQLFTVGFCAG